MSIEGGNVTFNVPTFTVSISDCIDVVKGALDLKKRALQKDLVSTLMSLDSSCQVLTVFKR